MATIEKRQGNENEITYRVKVRLKGFPAQTATFERLTDARKWAQQVETSIREGRYFKTSEARKHTLAEAIDRYIKTVLPNKPKSESDQKSQLMWWRETMGSYSLADVTSALIAEKRDMLGREITPRKTLRSAGTVNRYLAVLSHLFTIAMKEWGWVEENPLRKVTKPKEPRGRVRFLSDEERANLLRVCKESDNPYLYLIVVLALSTGARKMEIMGLRWQDVDLKRRVIILHHTKNGDRRILPLVGLAHNLLKEHAKIRHVKTDLIFPNRYLSQPTDIRTPWENALKKADIRDFRFHDTRHCCASYLAMNGATLAEIAEVLGHRTLAMIKRYAHLSEAHTAKVVEKMNQKIFGEII